jgi:hypothetical protein
MHITKLLDAAHRAAAAAKDGTLVINKVKYYLSFDHRRWLYIIHLGDNKEITNFNTKSLKQAREWLRFYLAN